MGFAGYGPTNFVVSDNHCAFIPYILGQNMVASIALVKEQDINPATYM